mmetsp:Transcript_41579/g.134351  ORF Transcript_41579/g.134351 Transcript_41579/m.134351 type:complete len:373 (+) Transcript_41579:155-1273(+)
MDKPWAEPIHYASWPRNNLMLCKGVVCTTYANTTSIDVLNPQCGMQLERSGAQGPFTQSRLLCLPRTAKSSYENVLDAISSRCIIPSGLGPSMASLEGSGPSPTPAAPWAPPRGGRKMPPGPTLPLAANPTAGHIGVDGWDLKTNWLSTMGVAWPSSSHRLLGVSTPPLGRGTAGEEGPDSGGGWAWIKERCARVPSSWAWRSASRRSFSSTCRSKRMPSFCTSRRFESSCESCSCRPQTSLSLWITCSRAMRPSCSVVFGTQPPGSNRLPWRSASCLSASSRNRNSSSTCSRAAPLPTPPEPAAVAATVAAASFCSSCATCASRSAARRWVVSLLFKQRDSCSLASLNSSSRACRRSSLALLWSLSEESFA